MWMALILHLNIYVLCLDSYLFVFSLDDGNARRDWRWLWLSLVLLDLRRVHVTVPGRGREGEKTEAKLNG